MNDLVAQARKASLGYGHHSSLFDKLADAIEALQAEVAARDLAIKQMQSAIEGMFGPTSQLSDDRFDKLSVVNGLQPSTEALDAYVAEKVAAERERCAKEAERGERKLSKTGKVIAASIRRANGAREPS